MCSLLPYGPGICHYALPFFYFVLCLSIKKNQKIFNMALINQPEWSMIPACPSSVCSFNKGNTEGTNFKTVFLMFVYSCMFCLIVVKWLVLWIDLTKGSYENEFWNVHLLMTQVWLSWGDPVWLTLWQDIRIQLRTRNKTGNKGSVPREFSPLDHVCQATGDCWPHKQFRVIYESGQPIV